MIAVDAYEDETREQVARFAEKLKLTHPILVGGYQASEDYGVNQELPMAFWIDHRGRVVAREMGFSPAMAKEEERRINELLAARDGARDKAPDKESTGKTP